MLCARGKDLAVEATGIEADAQTGRAHWVATYTYSATGRRVVNRIDAQFRFRDGLIVSHRDQFDLYGWLRALLGWAPPVQATVRAQANAALEGWIARASGSRGGGPAR
jgi:hypothetical protein